MFHRKDIVFTKPSIFKPGIEEYANQHTSLPPLETAIIQDRTIENCPEWANIATTPLQLTFLRMLTSLVRARRVLEVGTFTGHATLGIAEALPDDGRIITLDNFIVDERARDVALAAFASSEHAQKITLIEGDALETLEHVDEVFDLIFVDADKPNYINYYERILNRGLLAEHGLMVFDNTLWGGIVTRPPEGPSGTLVDHEGDPVEWLHRMRVEWGWCVATFNNQVDRDSRVENVILTVHDGMTLIRHAG
jgi:caffeoyl-CoA O-methyltransferase